MPCSLLIAIGLWLAINAALAFTAIRPWAVYEKATAGGWDSAGQFQFSRSGHEIIIGGGKINLRDVGSGLELSRLNGMQSYAGWYRAWDLVGKALVVRIHATKLQVWDMDANRFKREWTFPGDNPGEVAFSPEGTKFAMIDQDDVRGTKILIASVDPAILAQPDWSSLPFIHDQSRITQICISPAGDELAGLATSRSFKKWRIADGHFLGSLELRGAPKSWPQRTPILFLDENHVLAHNAIVNHDAWKVESELLPLTQVKSWVTALAHHGDFLYLGLNSGKVCRVNWKTKEVSPLLSSIVLGELECLAISPDGKLLAAGARRFYRAPYNLDGLFEIRAPFDPQIHFWRVDPD